MESSKIILVEDKKSFALKIKKKLENLGYNIPTIVSNGTDAIKKILIKKPDLIIVDLDLKSNPDSIESVAKINEKLLIPVLYLSSTQNKNFIDIVKKTNCAGYIFKPVKDIPLYATIETALYKSKENISQINILENYKDNEISNAVKFQKNILPKNNDIINNIKVNWLFYPSQYGSGDIFNYFKLGRFHIGFFILDVMGHGFNAALMSTIIQRILNPKSKNNIIIRQDRNNSINNQRRRKDDLLPSIVSPREVLLELNNRFYYDYQALALDSNFFFTIIYGIFNTITHETKLARAGHHYPFYQKSNGEITTIRSNGTAIGTFKDINIDEYVFTFKKGSRLMLYSDGLVEIQNGTKEGFSINNLYSFIKENKNSPQDVLIENLRTKIDKWIREDKIKDDIVFLSLEIKNDK